MSIKVEVIRSKRRRKTCCAQLKEDAIVVRIPHRMSRAEEKKVVGELTERLLKKKKRDELNREHSLLQRARQLCKKYLGMVPQVHSVRFVTNQNSCYGSCSVRSGRIRISHRLAKYPLWVLDYVILHEMVHLVHPNHSRDFHQLLNCYPLAERARGYLIAMSYMPDDTPAS